MNAHEEAALLARLNTLEYICAFYICTQIKSDPDALDYVESFREQILKDFLSLTPPAQEGIALETHKLLIPAANSFLGMLAKGLRRAQAGYPPELPPM